MQCSNAPCAPIARRAPWAQAYLFGTGPGTVVPGGLHFRGGAFNTPQLLMLSGIDPAEHLRGGQALKH